MLKFNNKSINTTQYSATFQFYDNFSSLVFANDPEVVFGAAHLIQFAADDSFTQLERQKDTVLKQN